MTHLRTGRKRKLQIPGPVDAPFKKLFTPEKGKKGGKGPGRPEEGPLTAIEQWGPKKGSKPKTPYLYGALGCNNSVVVHRIYDCEDNHLDVNAIETAMRGNQQIVVTGQQTEDKFSYNSVVLTERELSNLISKGI